MECPKCHKEMRRGFIQTTTSGGLCWVKKIHTVRPPYVDEEYMELATTHLILPTGIPGFNCVDCKIVVGDYSDI